MFTQTTTVLYIPVYIRILEYTRPLLLRINRENTVFAIDALMFAGGEEYMIAKCLIITMGMVKLWSGRGVGEELVIGKTMVDECKEVAAVIILNRIRHSDSEEMRKTKVSVFGFGYERETAQC